MNKSERERQIQYDITCVKSKKYNKLVAMGKGTIGTRERDVQITVYNDVLYSIRIGVYSIGIECRP